MQVSTRVACRIASIDRFRFNEAVHAGSYPNPPPTTKGAARTFDEDAVLKLTIYSLLVGGEGLNAKQAGLIADLAATLSSGDRDETAVICWKEVGGWNAAFGSEISFQDGIACWKSMHRLRTDAEKALALPRPIFAFSFRTLNVAALRALVRKQMQLSIASDRKGKSE